MIGLLMLVVSFVVAVEIIHAFRPAREAGNSAVRNTPVRWRQSLRRPETIHA
jgi:hypothetical protein